MVQIAGVAAAVASLLAIGIGAFSQVLKNYKMKSCKGLSLWLAITAFLSFSSWALYGGLMNDWFLIMSQTPGAVVWLVIITQFMVYRHR